jgi:hypothetical protein
VRKTMDVFAAALEATTPCRVGKSDAFAGAAPCLSDPTSMTPLWSYETIVLDDEPDPCAEELAEDCSTPSPLARSQVSSSSRGCPLARSKVSSRSLDSPLARSQVSSSSLGVTSSEAGDSIPTKRRKLNRALTHVYRRERCSIPTTVPLKDCPAELMCAFVGSGKGRAPLQLWPQYSVIIDGADVGSWVVAGTAERWVTELACNVAPHNLREKVEMFIQRVRSEFLTCLDRARMDLDLQSVALKDPLNMGSGKDDSASEPTSRSKEMHWVRKVRKPKRRSELPHLDMEVGKFTVTCVNDAKRMVMKADAATADFISGWMMPLMEEVHRVFKANRNRALHGENTQDSRVEDIPRPVGAFSLVGSAMPNIRGKICWDPIQHCWHIAPKSSTSPNTCKTPAPCHTFQVEPHLSPEQYAAAKARAYRAAVVAWNDHDCSRRHRIRV